MLARAKVKEANTFLNSMTIFGKSLVEGNNGSFNLFTHVFYGELTPIVDYINNSETESEIAYIACAKEPRNGKSALDITCYLGFRNIALYLLSLGADASLTDNKQRNTFHTVAYRGEYIAASMILNYQRYIEMKAFYKGLVATKQKYKFKDLDVDHGRLVATILHDDSTKDRFQEFNANVQELFKDYCDRIIKTATQALCQQDIHGKNPLHYAAQASYTRCSDVASLLLDIHMEKVKEYNEFLKLFDELQVLEIKEERKADPRRYVNIIKEIKHLLDPLVYKGIVDNFKKSVRELKERILNMGDNKGNTPLHIASYSGNFILTEQFLRLGADATVVNDRNQTPLNIAKNGLVRKVLSNLNKAAYEADIEGLKYLVNCGCEIDDKLSIFGEAPIHQSIKSNKAQNTEMLKAIIDCGADVNLIDSNGWTALHHAAEKGDIKAAQVLLEGGADVNAYSNNRRTPLHLASTSNNVEMIKLLLNNGANIEMETDAKCTALHYAAKKGNLESVKELLISGTDIYSQDQRLWSPLHYAAYNGHRSVVYFLLYWDADYEKLREMKNSQNKKAEEIVTDQDVKFAFNLIWKAASNGNLDMVRILHRQGQDIDEQTQFKKNTALHLAVINRHNLIIRYLLENGASSEIRNYSNFNYERN